jgi:hypothetical protein
VIVYGDVEPLLFNCPFLLLDAREPKTTLSAVVSSKVIPVGAPFAEKVAGGTKVKKLKPNEMTTRRTMRTCDKFIPFSSPIEPETQWLSLGQFKIFDQSSRFKL